MCGGVNKKAAPSAGTLEAVRALTSAQIFKQTYSQLENLGQEFNNLGYQRELVRLAGAGVLFISTRTWGLSPHGNHLP